tara:strand:+ start:293 stop:430 length:138 start_codon:yes stop_codon:yes gene_type:complete
LVRGDTARGLVERPTAGFVAAFDKSLVDGFDGSSQAEVVKIRGNL